MGKNNLFFAGHANHIDTLIDFIDRFGIENPVLIVSQHKKHLKDLEKLIKIAEDSNKFIHVKGVKRPKQAIPKHASQIKLFNTSRFVKLLESLLDEFEPDAVFVENCWGYYALLANICEKRNIKVNWVEEGLSIYDVPTINAYGPKKFKCNLSKVIFSFLKKPFLSSNSKIMLGNHTKFNKIYTANPGVLEGNFNAKEFILYQKYSIHNKNLQMRVKQVDSSLGITKNDIIFVAQPFQIDKDHFMEVMIPILGRFVDEETRIFIKDHPKSSKEFTDKMLFYIKYYNLQDRIILLENNTEIAELLIIKYQPKEVISACSSVLVYAKDFSDDIAITSIGKHFLSKVTNIDNGLRKHLEYANHALELFPHIKIID